MPCPGKCILREKVIAGPDTLDKFGEWLFSKQCKGSTVIVHNLQSYDSVILVIYNDELDHPSYHLQLKQRSCIFKAAPD